MIVKYEVINKITNRKKSRYDKNDNKLIFKIAKNYSWFLEVRRKNANNDYEYFILLSDKHFDVNCRSITKDNFGRYKITPKGDFKDYLINISEDFPNVKVNYYDSEDDYDSYLIEPDTNE